MSPCKLDEPDESLWVLLSLDEPQWARKSGYLNELVGSPVFLCLIHEPQISPDITLNDSTAVLLVVATSLQRLMRIAAYFNSKDSKLPNFSEFFPNPWIGDKRQSRSAHCAEYLCMLRAKPYPVFFFLSSFFVSSLFNNLTVNNSNRSGSHQTTISKCYSTTWKKGEF